MLLQELAGRNVSAGLREISNAALVVEMRQSMLMKFQSCDWFRNELSEHDAIRKQLSSIVNQLDSIQARVKELKEF